MREEVLALFQRYLPERLRPSGGGNWVTRCPFHKEGQERHPSFSVNPDKGVWHCFTCHTAGGIRDLLRGLGVSRSTIDTETKFVQPLIDKAKASLRFQKLHAFTNNDPFKAELILPETILGVFDFCPTMLVEKGFSPEILKWMDVGYDRTNNRITYPLRDLYGNLAGFSGGATPFTTVQPWVKYRVYQGGRRSEDGRTWIEGDFGSWFDEEFPGYRCENHDFLWNFDRVFPRILAMSDQEATVYVVEGFKACLWMMQNGYPNTVALMGSYVSDNQQRMLHRLGCNVVLFLDNDEAGRRATLRVGDLLWKPMYGRVRVVPYPPADLENSQPDDYPAEFLHQMVSVSQPYREHLKSSPLKEWFLGEKAKTKMKKKEKRGNT